MTPSSRASVSATRDLLEECEDHRPSSNEKARGEKL
jgi:hypothetical protein